MATPLRRIALLALVLLVSACGGASRRGPEPSMETDMENFRETTVRVENQAWADITMYVERPGERIRLGDVPSQGTRTFRLPEGIATTNAVRFIADPVGSNRTAQFFNVNIFPGAEYRLTVPNF